MDFGIVYLLVLVLSVIVIGVLIYYLYNNQQDLVYRMEGIEQNRFNEINHSYEGEDEVEESEVEDDEEDEVEESEVEEDIGLIEEPEEQIVEICDENCSQTMKTGKNAGKQCSRKRIENSQFCSLHEPKIV